MSLFCVCEALATFAQCDFLDVDRSKLSWGRADSPQGEELCSSGLWFYFVVEKVKRKGNEVLCPVVSSAARCWRVRHCHTAAGDKVGLFLCDYEWFRKQGSFCFLETVPPSTVSPFLPSVTRGLFSVVACCLREKLFLAEDRRCVKCCLALPLRFTENTTYVGHSALWRDPSVPKEA